MGGKLIDESGLPCILRHDMPDHALAQGRMMKGRAIRRGQDTETPSKEPQMKQTLAERPHWPGKYGNASNSIRDAVRHESETPDKTGVTAP
jgi:hypothetical protein